MKMKCDGDDVQVLRDADHVCARTQKDARAATVVVAQDRCACGENKRGESLMFFFFLLKITSRRRSCAYRYDMYLYIYIYIRRGSLANKRLIHNSMN